MLEQAGLSGLLASSLVGKTVAQAGEYLEVIFQIKAGVAIVTNGTVKGYSVEGQSVSRYTPDEMRACLRFIQSLRSTGGPVLIPISLSSSVVYGT
jgi:hypothetical protein